MNYLDAAIGFAIVMAVFAGAVTAVFEAGKRYFQVKAKNTLNAIYKLQEDIGKYKGVKLSAEDRFKLVASILDNPVGESSRISNMSRVAEAALAGKTSHEREEAFDDALKELKEQWKPVWRGFDKVSNEHVCRRTAEAMMAAGVDPTVIEESLEKISRDFNLYASSASDAFQKNARYASMTIGVAAALILNLNGYRILESFIENPQLAQSFTSQMEEFEKKVSEQRESIRKALSEAGEADSEKINSAVDALFQDQLEALRSTGDTMTDRGLPIGFDYRPHCQLSKKASCAITNEDYGPGSFIFDFLMMVFTGVLIGLGAPFWFDVAKKLATIRTWFKGTPSTSQAKSGSDDITSAKARKNLVKAIAADLKTDPVLNSKETTAVNKYRMFDNISKGSTLKFTVTDDSGGVHCRADLVDESQQVAKWNNADIKHPAEAAETLDNAEFYVLTLDLTFRLGDKATVRIWVEDSSGDTVASWDSELQSPEKQTHTYNLDCFIA